MTVPQHRRVVEEPMDRMRGPGAGGAGEMEKKHTQRPGQISRTPAARLLQLQLSEERITAAGGQDASLSEGRRVVSHLHPQSPLSRQKQSPHTPLD